MGVIILIRHGVTDWSLQNLRLGSSDIPLNTAGIEQAKLLSSDLKDVPLASIYTSDLQRALETSEIVRGLRELNLSVDARLRERDHGQFEGTPREVVQGIDSTSALDEKEASKFGVESLRSVEMRVLEVFRDIAEVAQTQTVAVVSHYGPLRIMLAASVGLGLEGRRHFDMDCGALSLITVDGDNMRLTGVNIRGELHASLTSKKGFSKERGPTHEASGPRLPDFVKPENSV